MKEIILGTLAVITIAITLVCWIANTEVTKDKKLEHPGGIKLWRWLW